MTAGAAPVRAAPMRVWGRGKPLRLLAFYGGTIGNFVPSARAALLSSIAGLLRPGDAVLLGTDLVKDTDRLIRAHDDALGVTAAFNLNVLRVVNRELGADFDPSRFEHVARYDKEREWIEMWLRSTGDQRVRIPELALVVDFARGEAMRTEIRAKFRLQGNEAELSAAGFAVEHVWTDAAGHYALSPRVQARAPRGARLRNR